VRRCCELCSHGFTHVNGERSSACSSRAADWIQIAKGGDGDGAFNSIQHARVRELANLPSGTARRSRWADEIEPETEPAPQAEPEPEPEPAAESEEEALSEPAWIPSFEMGFEAYNYDADTTITNLGDPPLYSKTDTGGVGWIVFRIGGELMGPVFEDLPGRPRFFVQGGLGFAAGTDNHLFEFGDPDDPLEPEGGVSRYFNGGPRGRDLPFEFEGQGSWLDADLQDPSWYAGLGIAFSVPTTTGLSFSIKPSIQYSAEDVGFEGKLKVVDETSAPGTVDPELCGPNNDPPTPLCERTFAVRESRHAFDRSDHSIGPGLEVAMAFPSARRMRISLFAQVRTLWLVSKKTSSSTDLDDLARYSVERDGFSVRGGVGVRLSWMGFN
jgi:hypothetical protein